MQVYTDFKQVGEAFHGTGDSDIGFKQFKNIMNNRKMQWLIYCIGSLIFPVFSWLYTLFLNFPVVLEKKEKINHYCPTKNHQSGLKPLTGLAFITPALRPGLNPETRIRWALAHVSRTIVKINKKKATCRTLNSYSG
jgi:hypothetical protein